MSRGEDLETLAPALAEAEVLIASEFVLAHEHFPRSGLSRAAPRLRWMHVSNAGIEKLLPLVFGAASCGSRDAAKSITDRFPLAAIVKVSFDPQAPGEAVIIPGKVDDSTWTAIYFLSFWFLLAAAATGMLVSVARSGRRPRPE